MNEVRERSREIPMALEAMESTQRDLPGFAAVPHPVQIKPNLVIEFFSR